MVDLEGSKQGLLGQDMISFDVDSEQQQKLLNLMLKLHWRIWKLESADPREAF